MSQGAAERISLYHKGLLSVYYYITRGFRVYITISQEASGCISQGYLEARHGVHELAEVNLVLCHEKIPYAIHQGGHVCHQMAHDTLGSPRMPYTRGPARRDSRFIAYDNCLQVYTWRRAMQSTNSRKSSSDVDLILALGFKDFKFRVQGLGFRGFRV